MKSLYLGNLSKVFDCKKLLDEIKDKPGELHNGNISLPPDNPEYENHLIQKKLAEEAGYNENGAIEFKHYKPEIDFDLSFVDSFSNFVNATPLVVFISEIKPGKMAPWHYDIDQFEEQNLKKGTLVRYHMHLSEPSPGHIFILGDEVFYNKQQGDVYQWFDRKSWHAGANCGMITKYLFNFKGYQ